MHELIEAYEEYIKLLADSEGMMLGIAVAHGFKCSAEWVERGQELRDRIAKLKGDTLTMTLQPDDIIVACKCGWSGKQDELQGPKSIGGRYCPRCGRYFRPMPNRTHEQLAMDQK